MNGDKEKRIIELAGDQEMMRLLNLATRNWEIAKNRVEQITQEREEGINDDNGVEMIPVFVRMERVYACMYNLLRRPQAYLLPSVINRLSPFINEKGMDAELVPLMSEKDESETDDFWTMLSENQTEGIDFSAQIKKMFTELMMKYVTPHLNPEGIEKVVDETRNVDSQVKSANEEGLNPEPETEENCQRQLHADGYRVVVETHVCEYDLSASRHAELRGCRGCQLVRAGQEATDGERCLARILG